MKQTDQILQLLARRVLTYDQLARELYGIERLSDPTEGQTGAVRSSVARLRRQGLVTTSRPAGTPRRSDGTELLWYRRDRALWQRKPAAVVVELADAPPSAAQEARTGSPRYSPSQESPEPVRRDFAADRLELPRPGGVYSRARSWSTDREARARACGMKPKAA